VQLIPLWLYDLPFGQITWKAINVEVLGFLHNLEAAASDFFSTHSVLTRTMLAFTPRYAMQRIPSTSIPR